MFTTDITIWVALGAGILSFVSPCCLPLYPSFISYITGVSVKDIEERNHLQKKRVLLHTLFFIMGFSIIYIALGMSASLIGQLFTSNQNLLRQLGGILIVVMGLTMVGIFKPTWMLKEKRVQLNSRPVGYVGSFLVGITYAAGWTPCIGPILTTIMTLGVTNPEQSVYYLTAYMIGFAVPFFIMSFFISQIKIFLKYSALMMKIGGGMMVVVGILLYTDQMTKITIFFIRLYGGFTGF
ncbi:cytochrome c biogenesis protein CcdA [Paenibacillus sp. JMULE4]|uniref:Cytochrome c biogenesis protein CcdA n=1 Tax=Paenibacillus validus TaxID=44253 RepID=A0A7X2ZDR8_9BACL|nr:MULTISPECIES: cytochrome c biogenesis protein CcdA [Paenibacillus]MUG73048.1 cytochrome c biogenesis protein CcdA [Paenibacillus validus]NTZ19481.1 cytochrome c biogenesis protein CcdA [Paenibacillus sp. JMULE4]